MDTEHRYSKQFKLIQGFEIAGAINSNFNTQYRRCEAILYPTTSILFLWDKPPNFLV